MDAEELYKLVEEGTITIEEAVALQQKAGKPTHGTFPTLDPQTVTDAGNTAINTLGAMGSGVIKAGQSIVNTPKTSEAFAKFLPSPDTGTVPIYTPDSKAMERVEAVSRGVTGMFGPGITGKGFMLGGLMGGAGQTAKESFPDSPSAQSLAEIATLLLGLPALRTPRDVKTTKQIVDELGTTRLEKIKAAQADASATLNTPTILSHFAPDNTALTALVKEILNSPEGAPLRESLRNEGRAMSREQATLPSDITPQRTFTVDDAKEAARAVETAKQAPFKDLRNKTKPYYEAAKGEMVPPDVIEALVDAIRGVTKNRALDRTGPVAQKVESYAMRVKNAGQTIPGMPGQPPGKVLGPNGKPIDPGYPPSPDIQIPPSAAEIDSIGKSARSAAETAGSKYNVNSVDKEAKVAMQDIHGVIKELVANADVAPNLAMGKKLHSEGMERLTPWSEGPLNDVFPKGASKPGKSASFASSMKWLRSGTTAVDDVKFVGEQVRKSNPDEFRMLVGQNVLNAAENSKSPQEFVATLIGEAKTATTRQAVFHESVNQAALAAGKTADEAKEAADGALKLLETLRTVSEGGEALKGSIQTGFSTLAGQNMGSKMLRFLNPIGMYIRAWAEAGPLENAIRRKVFKSLANTLSTPEGIDRLIEISKFDTFQHRTQILGRGLLGYEAQN